MVQLGQCSVKFWSTLLQKAKLGKLEGQSCIMTTQLRSRLTLGFFWMGKRQLHEDITGICKFRNYVEKVCVLIEVVCMEVASPK